MRRWKNEKDLAAMLIVRGQTNRGVRLTSETAYFVGLKLMTASEKPSRDAVARIICGMKCQKVCYGCMGKANAVVNAYGQGPDTHEKEGE